MSLFQRQSPLVQQLSQKNADAIGLVEMAPPEIVVPLLHSLLETERWQMIWRWRAVRLVFLVVGTVNLVITVQALLRGRFEFPLYIAALFLGLNKGTIASVRWKKALSGLIHVLPQVSYGQALRPLLFLTVTARNDADLMEKAQRKWLRERLTLTLARIPSSELVNLSAKECAQLVSLAVHSQTDAFLRCAVLLALAELGPTAVGSDVGAQLAVFVSHAHPESVREAAQECVLAWSNV